MDQQQIPPNTTNPYGDDEISLIDLLAVLVRFRRLISGGTLVAALVAGLYFSFLAPGGVTWSATATVAVNPVPLTWERDLGIDVVGTVQSLLSNDAPVWALGSAPRPAGAAAYSSTWDRNARTKTITFSAAEAEVAQTHLEAFLEHIGPALTTQLAPLFAAAARVEHSAVESARFAIAGAAAQAVQRATADPGGVTAPALLQYLQTEGGVTVAALVAAEQQLARITALAQDASPLMTVATHGVVSSPSGAGRTTKVIVAAISAFFLTVFLAFVLEYVRHVRADPEESAKLRSAWRRE